MPFLCAIPLVHSCKLSLSLFYQEDSLPGRNLLLPAKFKNHQGCVEVQITSNCPLNCVLIQVCILLSPDELLKPSGDILSEEKVFPLAQRASQQECA